MTTKKEYETMALEMVQQGFHYFDQWKNLSLWLACHRLVQQGNLKLSPVANCFDLKEVK